MRIKDQEKEIFFRQYRLVVEMADRIRARREGGNKIFISINSIIFLFLATRPEINAVHIFVGIFGILLSFVWHEMIKNYRALTSAKYKIIGEMEEQLPFKVYKNERKGNNVKLTRIERKVPWVFTLFYIIYSIFVCCVII